MQASPSGMASASQADYGGSDSRRLLQIKRGTTLCVSRFFIIKEITAKVIFAVLIDKQIIYDIIYLYYSVYR